MCMPSFSSGIPTHWVSSTNYYGAEGNCTSELDHLANNSSNHYMVVTGTCNSRSLSVAMQAHEQYLIKPPRLGINWQLQEVKLTKYAPELICLLIPKCAASYLTIPKLVVSSITKEFPLEKLPVLIHPLAPRSLFEGTSTNKPLCNQFVVLRLGYS